MEPSRGLGKHRVLLLGSGKIGRMIARFLVDSGDYQVRAADRSEQALAHLKKQTAAETQIVDASSPESLNSAMKGCDSVISALSFRFNPLVALVALELGASYFDLTEDIETAGRVRELAGKAQPGQIFMPQCGLAPGFISILAHRMTQEFDRLDTVRMRVGALPQFPSNRLKYNLTWSTDGLINEYCNRCEAIAEEARVQLFPLEGLEQFSLDGVRYEAFNTSGGLGTLCETLEGKVRELNYKTIRYLGHRDQMALLLQELRLSERREVLKDVLEKALPITFQDVVVVFCTVTGWRRGQLVQTSDARKCYARRMEGETWSAIQITTGAAACAVVDLHLNGKLPTQGFVRQEEVSLEELLQNRFGVHYRQQDGHGLSAGESEGGVTFALGGGEI